MKKRKRLFLICICSIITICLILFFRYKPKELQNVIKNKNEILKTCKIEITQDNWKSDKRKEIVITDKTQINEVLQYLLKQQVRVPVIKQYSSETEDYYFRFDNRDTIHTFGNHIIYSEFEAGKKENKFYKLINLNRDYLRELFSE